MHPYLRAYTPQDQPAFEAINRAWIETLFRLEPVDEAVLRDPETHILAPGGAIRVAQYPFGPVLGVVALRANEEPGAIELTKLGVDERARGLGLGEALTRDAVAWAFVNGYRRVVLYSSRSLGPALGLYRKMGFREVDVEPGKYARCDIKMAFDLTDAPITDRPALLAEFGQGFHNFCAVLAGIPRAAWGWKPSPREWSINEVLVHEADSEANCYIRIGTCIAEPGSPVRGYTQDVWAALFTPQHRDPLQALHLFGQLRALGYERLRQAPPEAWAHTVEHSENGTMTLHDILVSYTRHSHIGQIRRIHGQWLAAGQPVG